MISKTVQEKAGEDLRRVLITFKLQQLNITPLVAWRREARKEEALDDLLERTRDGHCQSDEHWNCFKGNLGKLLREGWTFQ